MPRVSVGPVELEYREVGDAGREPLLLIMGLGAQLTRWPEPFVQALAGAGYRVVLFDNRDVGLSSRLTEAGQPQLVHAAMRAQLGLPVEAPYTLDDLAQDALGLCDALGIARAHVLGVSMGGMIAQILADRHAARVATLTSIMSSSGARHLPQARLDIRMRLVWPAGKTREARIDAIVSRLRAIASPAYPPDVAELRAAVARDADRGPDRGGFARQLAAILASSSRGPFARDIRVPTLIIHGAADPLVRVACAHDLHRRVAGSTLEIIAGMGHDLPAPLVPHITRRIVEHLAGSPIARTMEATACSS